MKRSLGAGTFIFPTPVWVIGSYDKDGKPDVMTAAWGGVCSSKPPAVSVSIRKATLTHGNITARKAFTVNVPSAKQIKEADHFGVVSGRDEDKLAKAGMTAVKSDKVDAPYVKEFSLVIECRLIQTHEVGIHTQFIGEIMDVKADEFVLGKNGMPDPGKIDAFFFDPSNRGYVAGGSFLEMLSALGNENGDPFPCVCIVFHQRMNGQRKTPQLLKPILRLFR